MKKLSKLIVLALSAALCFTACQTETSSSEPTYYTVTVSSSIEHGKVTADKSSAEAGATIKLTATADSGYELESYSVKDTNANDVTVTDGTFTMPKSNVTVSATFKATAVTPQKTAGSISYATTTVSKTTADEAFTNALTKTGDGTVTYASSKTDVATVNASTGEVTIVGAGTAIITATVADSDTYTYATKTASYTLTVTQSVTIPEGFVKVTGTTITGTETWTPSSSVFVSGRSLTIPDLYVCDHEVTRGEFKALMGTDPSIASAYDKDGNELTGDAVLNNPVNYVNWYAAIAYCNKLSVKEGLDCAYTVSGITDWENLAYSAIPTSIDSTWNAATCDFEANGYRLPTEAEWEWLARGGQDYTYSGSNTIDDVAWYTTNTNYTGSRDVKTKAANAYGLYDMSGNVWEWCWDWYESSISSSTDEAGSASGFYRVARGGSWRYNANGCSVSYRGSNIPNNRSVSLGFRVVRSSSN